MRVCSSVTRSGCSIKCARESDSSSLYFDVFLSSVLIVTERRQGHPQARDYSDHVSSTYNGFGLDKDSARLTYILPTYD